MTMNRMNLFPLRHRAMLPVAMTLALIAAGCADGYESPNGFDVGVSDQTLVTPPWLAFVVSTDGTKATISWPLVLGCEGYEVTMTNIDNPDSTYIVDHYDHYLVDGCSMTANVQEDSRYAFQFKVVGNPKFNNRDGEVLDTIFSTLVPSIVTVPDGSDIYKFFTENPIAQLADDYRQANNLDTLKEIAIDLQMGGHYTMSGPLEFEGYNMTFRGAKAKPALVTMTDSAAFFGWGGMKLKFLRFDCTNCTAGSLIYMSETNFSDANLSQNLGYERNGSPINDLKNVLNPVYLSDVWVKNLRRSLVHDNNISCCWWNLSIINCIIQGCNSTSSSFISFDQAGHIIKEVIIRNSTLYNIYDNSSAYFLRFQNQSNANVQKCYGTTSSELASQIINFTNVTFSKIYTGQKWFNNINGTGLSGTFSHCIFYDLYQPFRRSMEKGGTWSCRFNFFFNPDDDSDTDYTRKDSSGSPCASLYDPQFQGDVTQELDLEAPNGGVNFRSGEYMIVSNAGGDTRWL